MMAKMENRSKLNTNSGSDLLGRGRRLTPEITGCKDDIPELLSAAIYLGEILTGMTRTEDYPL